MEDNSKTMTISIRERLIRCAGAFLLLLLVSCGDKEEGIPAETGTYIPEAPDYADATMWYTRENGMTDRSADLFYLVSTWETDWTTEDGRVCHYADVHNATHRANMDKEISRVADYMGEAGDFYSPYYRHAARHHHRHGLARAPRAGGGGLQRLGIPAHPGFPQRGRFPQRRAVALPGMPAREHPGAGGGLLR